MQKIQVTHKSIMRAGSHQEVENGWFDELINLKHKDGKLRPVGLSRKVYELPDKQYRKIWKHEHDNVDNFVGITETGDLDLINMELGTSETIKTYPFGFDELTVFTLKRFLIATANNTMDIFIFKDGKYRLQQIYHEPYFNVESYDEQFVSNPLDLNQTAQGILGAYYKRLNEKSKDNMFTGGMLVRAAYKLFDGSYVFHTIPRLLSVNSTRITLRRYAADKFRIEFFAAKAKAIINTQFYLGMTQSMDIIDSVCFFATQAQPLIQIDGDTITDEFIRELINLPGEYFGRDVYPLNNFLEVSLKYKSLVSEQSYYKIGEVPLADIIDHDNSEGWALEKDLDLKDFYQDYATRETLPIDQFSHHSLAGKFGMNYNSRAVLLNTTLRFKDRGVDGGSKYQYRMRVYANETSAEVLMTMTHETVNTVIEFLFDTDEGKKNIWTKQKLGVYNHTTIFGTTQRYIVLNGIIGYPDTRAKEVRIHIETSAGSGSYKHLKTFKLEKHKSLNYAYYFDNNFYEGLYNISDSELLQGGDWNNLNMIPIPILPSEFGEVFDLYKKQNRTIYDSNRLQVSELNNPFFFPAKYSYRIGTGTVIACATNAEPLSTGQFGQYPLSVFTSKGIWSLNQGQGDILFVNVSPVNGEVIESPDDVLGVGSGVVYKTREGVYLLSGMQVSDIFLPLKGMPNIDFQANTDYQYRTSNPHSIDLNSAISTVSGVIYAKNALFGFDKHNNELILTNKEYRYSYVFSFVSNSWHKISSSFDVLINAYPTLLGVSLNGSDDGVFSLSLQDEISHLTGNKLYIPVLYTTRPIKLPAGGAFSLIHRLVQRGEMDGQTGTYTGIYIYGSNDLKIWQLLTGTDRCTGFCTDLRTTRTHKKLKYYILVFSGNLSCNSAVNYVDIQYYQKLFNKIR